MRAKQNLISEPVRIGDMDFDYLYEQISNDWPEKARRLQIRRWRAIKRSTKGY